MKLDHLTSASIFEINAPIWNGGVRKVGLNMARITKHNEIHFMYVRKSNGLKSFPDTYYFNGENIKARNYQLQNVRGTVLVLVPFSELEILERA